MKEQASLPFHRVCCSVELSEHPGLMVPWQRSGWPLLSSSCGQYEVIDEKQPVSCSFTLSLSGNSAKAGFLKLGSETVVLFALAVGYETDSG